jgi:hypothetical protein
VRDIVVEWRYAANLAVYIAMDKVGIFFKDEFPDWQRSPLSLEIKDKKNRRRLAMMHNRAFYHVAGVRDPNEESELSLRFFDRLAHELEISRLTRVGIRQWSIFPRQDGFRELVKLCAKKFQQSSDTLKRALQGTMDDMAYVAEVTHADGWKYNLRLGPMDRDQWKKAVSHEEDVFDSEAAYNEYVNRLPANFLYVDVDAYKEDIGYADSKILVKRMGSVSRDIASDLSRYLEEA